MHFGRRLVLVVVGDEGIPDWPPTGLVGITMASPSTDSTHGFLGLGAFFLLAYTQGVHLFFEAPDTLPSTLTW